MLIKIYNWQLNKYSIVIEIYKKLETNLKMLILIFKSGIILALEL